MSGAPHPELEGWRGEFPIFQHRLYLNSCSLGPLSRRSMGYLGEYQALWNSLGASAWYELWMGRLAELRRGVARLWDAREAEVALAPSASGALSSVASAVDYGRRSRVVVAELDFPTLAYQWMGKPGVEVVQVPSDDGVTIDPARWAEYVDERTAVVATSHVFYSTGTVQDLGPIAEAARAAGALFLVDGYHAMGQMPVHPRALDADVYVAGPLKWMLGGPGLAFLWVREERIRELRPSIASWFGARDQFRFRMDALELREDAGRFSMGTPSVPTAYTALGGVEIVEAAGPARIRERVSALAQHLIDGAHAEGYRVRTAADPAARSGIVMIQVPGAAEVVQRLGQRGLIVDHRDGHIRASPHFYNTEADNQALLAALREEVGRAKG